MDFEKLFKAQKELDSRIEKGKSLTWTEKITYKFLALRVELGELANEWRGFKYWSENRNPRTKCPECKGTGYCHYFGFADPLQPCDYCNGYPEKVNPLLEEYVDCLHFILGIGNDLEFNNPFRPGTIIPAETAVAFNSLFRIISTLQYSVERSRDYGVDSVYRYAAFSDYETLLFTFIELGKQLGFNWKQVEEAYYIKNEINHERQSNGY